VAGPGFASSGIGTGVTTGGSAGRSGCVSGGGVTGAGACGAGAGAGSGVPGAGTFAGGVAQEHNAAAINEIRKRGNRRMQEERDSLADRLVDASGVAAQELATAALYVVATPIGNLADLTVRAWWVLSHVDAIAAEDTRVTRHLLDRYRIDIPPARLIAAHEHNERSAAERVLALLHEGLRVALVSDAGTPAISDPGAAIVQAVRAAGLRVIPVPGASSLAAALSVAGFNQSQTLFVGFLPTAARERAQRLQTIARSDAATVLFEAPHRLRATVEALVAVLAPTRRLLIARELTKRFETIETVAAENLVAHVAATEPRGEYVLVVEPAQTEAVPAELDAMARRWLAAIAEVLPPARAAAVAAQATGLPRDVLYRELTRGREDKG
jgi:16S rRNA (cytidine1402-2'-O)-methyltransferase